jgi:hypothetical protein
MSNDPLVLPFCGNPQASRKVSHVRHDIVKVVAEEAESRIKALLDRDATTWYNVLEF